MALITLLSACGPSLPAAKAGGQGSSVTAISIGLPDRSALKAEVADIEQKMDSYHLAISPLDASCPNATQLNQVNSWNAASTTGASLQQGCDYEVVLALGQGPSGANAASATNLAAIYYKNNKPLRILKEDIAGRAEYRAPLQLQLQDEGRKIGLGAGAGGG